MISQVSAPRSSSGVFWDTDQSGNRLPGYFHIHESRPFLDLGGETQLTKMATPATMSGSLDDGRSVLLLRRDAGIGFMPEDSDSLDASYRHEYNHALVAETTQNIENFRIARMTVQFQRLTEWCKGLEPIDNAKVKIGSNLLIGEEFPTVDVYVAITNKCDSTLEFVLIEDAAIDFTSLGFLDQLTYLAQRFLSCLIGRSAAVTSSALETTDGVNLRWESYQWVQPHYGQMSHSAFAPLSLFTELPTLMNRFQAASQRLEPMAYILSGSLSVKTFVEPKFASLAAGLEGVHKLLSTADGPLPRRRWAEISKAELKKSREHVRQLPIPQSQISALLETFKNERTFEQKAADVLSFLGADVADSLGLSEGGWPTKLKKYRNKTAHEATFKGVGSEVLHRAYSHLSFSLCAVMLLILLKEMDASHETQVRTAMSMGSRLSGWENDVA
ncbi:hypothetical protein OD998_10200 [Paenarthrobacter nicotinovorans]